MKPERQVDGEKCCSMRVVLLAAASLLLPSVARADGGTNTPASAPQAEQMDRNGLPVPWEMKYFGKTGLDASSSPSGNGFTLLEAYEDGLDPTNYYSQPGSDGRPTIIVPKLRIVSGDQQIGGPGAKVDSPLVVQVADSTGKKALPNAPVVFTLTTDGGSLGGGNGVSGKTVNVQAGLDGQAQATFIASAQNGAASKISASAGGVAITFSESTTGGDGKFDAPTDFNTTSPGIGAIDMTWVNHATAAKFIIIQQSTDNVNWKTLVTLPPTATSYHASGLSPNDQYWFRIYVYK